MRKQWRRILAMLLAGSLVLGGNLPVMADEVKVSGNVAAEETAAGAPEEAAAPEAASDTETVPAPPAEEVTEQKETVQTEEKDNASQNEAVSNDGVSENEASPEVPEEPSDNPVTGGNVNKTSGQEYKIIKAGPVTDIVSENIKHRQITLEQGAVAAISGKGYDEPGWTVDIEVKDDAALFAGAVPREDDLQYPPYEIGSFEGITRISGNGTVHLACEAPKNTITQLTAQRIDINLGQNPGFRDCYILASGNDCYTVSYNEGEYINNINLSDVSIYKATGKDSEKLYKNEHIFGSGDSRIPAKDKARIIIRTTNPDHKTMQKIQELDADQIKAFTVSTTSVSGQSVAYGTEILVNTDQTDGWEYWKIGNKLPKDKLDDMGISDNDLVGIASNKGVDISAISNNKLYAEIEKYKAYKNDGTTVRSEFQFILAPKGGAAPVYEDNWQDCDYSSEIKNLTNASGEAQVKELTEYDLYGRVTVSDNRKGFFSDAVKLGCLKTGKQTTGFTVKANSSVVNTFIGDSDYGYKSIGRTVMNNGTLEFMLPNASDLVVIDTKPYGDNVMPVVDKNTGDDAGEITAFFFDKKVANKGLINSTYTAEGLKKLDGFAEQEAAADLIPGTYYVKAIYDDKTNGKSICTDNIAEVTINKAEANVGWYTMINGKLVGDTISDSDILLTNRKTGGKALTGRFLSEGYQVYENQKWVSYPKNGNYKKLDSAGTYRICLVKNGVSSDYYKPVQYDTNYKDISVVSVDSLILSLRTGQTPTYYYGADEWTLRSFLNSNVVLSSNGKSITADLDKVSFNCYRDSGLTSKYSYGEIENLNAGEVFYVRPFMRTSEQDITAINSVSVSVLRRPVYIGGKRSVSRGSAEELKIDSSALEVDYDRYAGTSHCSESKRLTVQQLTGMSSLQYLYGGLTKEMTAVNGSNHVIVVSLNNANLTAANKKNYDLEYYDEIQYPVTVTYHIDPVYYIRYSCRDDSTDLRSAKIADYIYPKGNKSTTSIKGPGDFKTLFGKAFTSDYIFEGWQMVDDSGQKIYNTVSGSYMWYGGNNISTKDVTSDIELVGVVSTILVNNKDNKITIHALPDVSYTGKPHISSLESDKGYTFSNDLEIVLEDKLKGTVLIPGKEYSIKHSNNTNASVKYKDDGTVEPLYSDPKKRPQVVIKGKDNYKGLDKILYYDILPRNLKGVDNVYISGPVFKVSNTKEFYFDEDGNTPIPFYLNKKGGNKISVKGEVRLSKREKKAYEVKASNLRLNKDYTFKLQKESSGGWEDVPGDKIAEEGNFRIYAVGIGNYTGINTDGFFSVFDGTPFSSAVKVDYNKSVKMKHETTPKDDSDDEDDGDNESINRSDDDKYSAKEAFNVYDDILKSVKTKSGTELTKEDWFLARVEYQDPELKEYHDYEDCEELHDAGKYKIYLSPSSKWSVANKIFGSKVLDVTVNGFSLGAGNFICSLYNDTDGTKIDPWDVDGRLAEPTVCLKGVVTGYEDGEDEKGRKKRYPVIESHPAEEYCTLREEDHADSQRINVTEYAAENFYQEYAKNPASGLFEEVPTGELWSGVLLPASPKAQSAYNYKFYYIHDNNAAGTYKVKIRRWGPYAGAPIMLSYKRNNISFQKAMDPNYGGRTLVETSGNSVYNANGASILLKSFGYTGDGSVVSVSEDVTYRFYAKGYRDNKKIGKATATIAADKNYPGYYTGDTKLTFSIEKKSVSSTEVHPYSEALEMKFDPKSGKYYYDLVPGDIYVDVEDATEGKDPKVTLYQASFDGRKLAKLRSGKDYNFRDDSAGKVGTGLSIKVTNGSERTFDFSADAMNSVSFSRAVKKAGKVEAALENEAYTYTGSPIRPKLSSLVVDGENYDLSVSNNGIYDIAYTNNTKTGTGKATVYVHKTADGKNPAIGKKTVSFKIIPMKVDKVD